MERTPSEKKPLEFSAISIITGIVLSLVFGAANAYLGLRVGMTISASIPAAVISMIVMRILLRRRSILENNIVQTIASAGESLASGVVFTVPAFYLWEKEGVAPAPPLSAISLFALFGGILGVLFMIPLRHHLIVGEDKKLAFPEGRACAEVLHSADSGGKSGRYIFWGMGAGALVKFLIDGIRAAAPTVTVPVKKLFTEVSAEPYPALLGVGYICGLKVSAMLLAGGILSWLVLIPLIVFLGGESGSSGISAIYAAEGPQGIWCHYIRYIGAGAVATGGILGLVKSLPVILSSFMKALKGFGQKGTQPGRTEKDMDGRVIFGLAAGVFILLLVMPQIPLNAAGVFLFMVCGFFFSAVASRIAGMVGSSNSPASGMTIAALLVSACILKKTGMSGSDGMIASLVIATMCCIIACIAGDVAQDLKTGHLLGATPWKQQLGEIIGIVFSAGCIGGVIVLLNNAWGFGSTQLPAPQAHLMKLITEGVMQDKMSWVLVLAGCAIALTVECLGVSSLCAAIGVFLPMSLTMPVFLGGLARYFIEKRNGAVENGVLFSSGLIAGEGLTGILLAVATVLHFNGKMDFSPYCNSGMAGSGVCIAAIILLLCRCCSGKTKQEA